jgi:hypothetical protein
MHAVAESGPRQGTTTALCFVFVSGGENTKTTPHTGKVRGRVSLFHTDYHTGACVCVPAPPGVFEPVA